MSSARPTGVTVICALAAAEALFTLVTAQQNVGDYETSRLVEANPRQAQFQQIYSYVHAGLTLLAAYFMLQARNWARWLYLSWSALRLALAITLIFLPDALKSAAFLRFEPGMIPGALFFLLALVVLCRGAARDYFAHNGEPWWRE